MRKRSVYGIDHGTPRGSCSHDSNCTQPSSGTQAPNQNTRKSKPNDRIGSRHRLEFSAVRLLEKLHIQLFDSPKFYVFGCLLRRCSLCQDPSAFRPLRIRSIDLSSSLLGLTAIRLRADDPMSDLTAKYTSAAYLYQSQLPTTWFTYCLTWLARTETSCALTTVALTLALRPRRQQSSI
jgi:hypothetical protein